MTDINYFDGYNHEEMKKTIPMSSLLMFDGEDLSFFIIIKIGETVNWLNKCNKNNGFNNNH